MKGIKVKKGVNMDLCMPMSKPLSALAEIFSSFGKDLVITDARAPRKSRSLHPLGLAFDFRTRHLNDVEKDIIIYILRLMEGYDVIEYKTHIHVEYQKHLDDLLPMTITEIEVVD